MEFVEKTEFLVTKAKIPVKMVNFIDATCLSAKEISF